MARVMRNVIVTNPQGLHARPAQLFAQIAMQFQSQIELVRDNVRVDGKSIMHMLTLGVVQGTQLTVEADGSDAKQAVDALVKLVQSDFADNESVRQEKAS